MPQRMGAWQPGRLLHGCYYVVRMSALSRIGVAIDSVLLEKFDKLIGRRGYTNRSEAFRDLIREELVEEAWESPAAHVVGTVTLVYDHHVRLLSEKLTAIQHDYHHSILSTLHVHLDHDHCLEVLVVRGQSALTAILPRCSPASPSTTRLMPNFAIA